MQVRRSGKGSASGLSGQKFGSQIVAHRAGSLDGQRGHEAPQPGRRNRILSGEQGVERSGHGGVSGSGDVHDFGRDGREKRLEALSGQGGSRRAPRQPDAPRSAQGRLLSLLEGGYDLQALAEAAGAHVQRLMEQELWPCEA